MARWCILAAAVALLVSCACAADSSKLPDLPPGQQAEVDDMVNNLLQWIQGLYQQRNRKARQYFGGKPEKPRPFEPATYLPPPTGYPPAGSRPTPSYSDGPSQPNPSYEPPYVPSQPTQSPYNPTQGTQPPYNPNQGTQPTYNPSQGTQPSYNPTQGTQTPYQPSQGTQPASQPDEGYQYTQPNQPTYQPNQPTYQPSNPTYQPSNPTYQPTNPTQPSYQPTQPAQTNPPVPSNPEVTQPAYEETQGSQQTQQQEQNQGQQEITENETQTSGGEGDDDDDRHPPHIHAITVDCGKEMMTINVEFNKPYNGIIYSQDHFNEPECVYVQENSNQVKFSFTVSLNSCGTKFFSDFENEGQAYLENVLVLQNEPGIQEVWDHIRRVRCLWEGNLTKQLVSSLSVGMLNQITSNFSGDTAMARLDIQTGRGPFAPEADGLIKIGETMTLVVSVTGDAGFDILVRECIARDADSKHEVMLTDHNGCVLKPKLFGAFQKTRETGNTGASILAYAFFNAFKFPDEMDLIIQCDVELCKTDCDACPNPGSLDPKRRRRDVIHVGNRTEPTTIGKGLRVVFAEELPQESGFCVSQSAAVWGSGLVLIAALMSSAIASYCWKKTQVTKCS